MGAGALLDCVGLSGPEEALYLRLLAEPGSTAAELGERLGSTPALIRARLSALVSLGLAAADRDDAGGGPRDGVLDCAQDDVPDLDRDKDHATWRATAPDIALEALVRGREAELMRLRGRVEELMRGYRHGRRAARPDELIEVVSGREAIAACWQSLQSGASSSLRILDKAPHILVASPQDESAVLRRGVRVEVIYEHEAVRDARALAAIRGCMDLGEQARMLPTLPFKLALVDDRWALLPVSTGTALDSALVVRPCSLLDALSGLFDLCWSQAMRIPRTEPDGAPAEATVLTEPLRRRRDLLTLLAAGLTDDSIARQLGISTRTVQRLIRDFMDSCGARTRFQAGVQAAREELI